VKHDAIVGGSATIAAPLAPAPVPAAAPNNAAPAVTAPAKAPAGAAK
jgi:hypothetical protein